MDPYYEEKKPETIAATPEIIPAPEDSVTLWEIAKELTFLQRVLAYLNINSNKPADYATDTIKKINTILQPACLIEIRTTKPTANDNNQELLDLIDKISSLYDPNWPSYIKQPGELKELLKKCIKPQDTQEAKKTLKTLIENLITFKNACDSHDVLIDSGNYLKGKLIECLENYFSTKYRKHVLDGFFQTCKVNYNNVKIETPKVINRYFANFTVELNDCDFHIIPNLLAKLPKKCRELAGVIKTMHGDTPKGFYDDREMQQAKEQTATVFATLETRLSSLADTPYHFTAIKKEFEAYQEETKRAVLLQSKSDNYALLKLFNEIHKLGGEILDNLKILQETIDKDQNDFDAAYQETQIQEPNTFPHHKVLTYYKHAKKISPFMHPPSEEFLFSEECTGLNVGQFLLQIFTNSAFVPVFELILFVSQEYGPLITQFKKFYSDLPPSEITKQRLKDITELRIPLYMKRPMNFNLSLTDLQKKYQTLLAKLPKEHPLKIALQNELTCIVKLANFIKEKSKAINEQRTVNDYIEKIDLILESISKTLTPQRKKVFFAGKNSPENSQPQPYLQELIQLRRFLVNLANNEYISPNKLLTEVANIVGDIANVITDQQAPELLVDLLKEMQTNAQQKMGKDLDP